MVAGEEEQNAGGPIRQIGAHFEQSATQGAAVGMPTGQPNSTALMSTPILNRSSVAIDFGHAQTGSAPSPVR